MADQAPILSSQRSPSMRRAELLGDETVAFLRALAAGAPPLTCEQRDVIRDAFEAAL